MPSSAHSRSSPTRSESTSVSEQRELDRLLATAQAEGRMPSVSACVFRDGEIVWERVLGVADVATSRAATANDVYRIGSITKTFTAVLVMQLVDAGRIELDAPLRTYLPEAPVGPTVRQALSHLTGLQREPPGEIWESMQPPSREELIAGLENAELVLQPAEQWHYSNLVFALLGEIVMRTGALPYEELLQQRILDPLGLARTSLRPDEPKASPYYVDPYTDAARDEPDPEVTDTTAAAGWLWSTAGDLARWGTFLADGDDAVLPKATIDLMSRVRTMADERNWTVGWGLGLELFRRGDRVFVGHGGAMPGFLAGLVVDRGERTGAAVLMNTGANADPIALSLDLLVATLEGQPRPLTLWAPAGEASSELDGILGSWWTEGEEMTLSLRGGRFQAELRDAPSGRTVSIFEPDGVDRWRVAEGRERGELLRAVRDEDGTVTKLYFATYPLTRTPSTFG